MSLSVETAFCLKPGEETLCQSRAPQCTVTALRDRGEPARLTVDLPFCPSESSCTDAETERAPARGPAG